MVATTVRNKEKTEAWVQLLPNVPEELVPWSIFGVASMRVTKVPLVSVYRGWLLKRVFPKERIGAMDELKDLGLKEYNPMEIIKKTSGGFLTDDITVELEGAECNSYALD